MPRENIQQLKKNCTILWKPSRSSETEVKTSQRVMRWMLLLEEYGPEIKYIKGPKNVVADALSRLSNHGDIVVDVDAVLPFVPVDDYIFPVQL